VTPDSHAQSSLISRLGDLLPASAIITQPSRLAEAARSNPLHLLGQPPICIVTPADSHELQAVIQFANQLGLSLTVASSTGAHRNGGITSPVENVLVDLSHWRQIDLIDRRNRVCRIQPGVTYGQLSAALSQHGMCLPLPLAPRNGKSVLASVMDREPSTWPNKQWDSSDPVCSTEFFFGSGECFRTGSAGGPGSIQQQRKSGGAQKFSSGPSQADFHRLLQGAQGTMGILTWITLRLELEPTLQKPLLIGGQELGDLLPFVYAVQRGLLGEQSFILDRTAAAMLLANGSMDRFDILSSELPAFICFQNIAGFERLPRERLDYQLNDIAAFARQFSLHLEEGIASTPASELLACALHPCGEIDWRDALHGASLSVFFLSTLDRTTSFRELFFDIAADFGISGSSIGTYVQPVVQNHACHVEFILPFDPDSEAERDRMQRLERRAVNDLMDAGAFFSRPYGSAAELVWSRNPVNYQLLKTIKAIFDPQRVLQRGKWGL
jgi:FAD/FMN-containing dehydrogenase